MVVAAEYRNSRFVSRIRVVHDRLGELNTALRYYSADFDDHLPGENWQLSLASTEHALAQMLAPNLQANQPSYALNPKLFGKLASAIEKEDIVFLESVSQSKTGWPQNQHELGTFLSPRNCSVLRGSLNITFEEPSTIDFRIKSVD